MWPLDLPAHEVLKLPGETATIWAVFDWRWYLNAYPDVIAFLPNDNPSAVLEYYLEHGQKCGHSPNRLFDERWHRLAYPQIADQVASGNYHSAFDAYCRRGALDRSAHWLFDEVSYRDQHPDLTDDVLTEYAIVNRYDHYLRHGSVEGRIGHCLFDPSFYLSQFDPADVAAIRQMGPFQHYLQRIESGEPELPTSVYFDPAWYLTRYPEVGRHIEAGRWKSALHHYLCNDTPTAFDPSASFSEAWYLRRDPGLLKVIGACSFRNGYMHFLGFGARELRSPTASIDLAWYAEQPLVRSDLQQGRATDAYTHWLKIGSQSGLQPAAPETTDVSDLQGRRLIHQTAAALLPIAGRFGYAFECQSTPVVSVVVAVRDGFATTMATIASLRSNSTAEIELIIVDRGSSDETCSIGHYLPGVKILRFESDIGWSRAADAGGRLATAAVILFLASTSQILPGSIDRALVRLTADPSIGAVGGMILQPHGVVGQAGGILWSDGSLHDYQRGESPLAPEVNFVRDVDFCASDFLMMQTELFFRLDGFDHECARGYETVDLSLRIAHAGLRVVYDPSVAITSGDTPVSGISCDYFRRKHEALLAARFTPEGQGQVFARHTGKRVPRVLFIEDTIPLRRIGSGFVRSNDLIRAMSALGYAVTVFPVNGSDHDPANVFGDMPEQVEVMHTLSLDKLASFLASRPGYYDVVWVARIHNLARVRPILQQLPIEATAPTRVILDTEAVTPYREAMQAELAGSDYDLPNAMRAVLADMEICQHVVAVTDAEAQALHSYGVADVSVVGHWIEPKPTMQPFTHRAGLLFVGAIHQEDSPNLDSLVWFADAVLPLIETELKWETRLTIAGYIAPGLDLRRFAQHPRITLNGPVANLQPLYDRHRIFVAPTRYAAGAPYKVLEAASYGLPVIATEVLSTQLDWQPNEEIVAVPVDDPAVFAARLVALYRDEVAWQTIREGALQRLQRNYHREGYFGAVASVLDSATATKQSPEFSII